MKEKSASGILGTAIEKLRELVDVNTIIGQPIELGDVKVIPVSKAVYGFASGGSDFPSKNNQELFGGGGGASVSITPVCFLIVSGGEITVRHISTEESSVERMIGMVPDLVDKVSGTVNKLVDKFGKNDDAVIAEAVAQFQEKEQ
ncbi:MAG: GerW family sporulation protein [Oscillospiraceae bacterium]|jgi:sporulation protein YtfJ|nr:GerW family sporulation protein [Oscillospiraceae bacterium]